MTIMLLYFVYHLPKICKFSHQIGLMNPISISTVEFRPQDGQEEKRGEVMGTDAVRRGQPREGRRQSTPSAVTAFQNTAVPNVSSVIAPPSPLPPFKTLARGSAARTASGVVRSKRVFKVIIIGDAGVGKTCLSYRFCNGRFPGPTEATIGVDFRERSLRIDDELIRVQLWDTAGQERYRQSIVAHYYRNVNAVVFVYDVFDPKSFRSLPAWIDECRKHALTASDDTPHILIGNKCDLQSKRGGDDAAEERKTTTMTRVKTDQAQVFADENDMALFETSALADSEADHVESIFLTLVHKLRQSKPMHVQSTEERSRREQQKILLKADEAAKLTADEDGGGMCC